MGVGYSILFHDDTIVVLDKASGLLSVPGIGADKADCLATRVVREFPTARIVHRLDRDTSGVIVMALDATTHRDLSIQFQERRVAKAYVALVAGHVASDRGEIDLPMRKQAMGSAIQIVDHEQGRPCLTHYEVAERTRRRELDITRLILRPHTGRSHQLRVHCAAIGHAILGDDLYAPDAIRKAADRLCLHAWTLAFRHPASKCEMRFEAPLPF